MTADTLVLVPTYNERENAPRLVEDLLKLPAALDLLFVDDGSPDGTGALLDAMAARNPRLTVIHRPGKQGIGGAHQTGLRWARERGYRRVVTLDADFTHPPSYIPRFLEAGDKADVVVGSRYLADGSLAEWNLYRLLLTRLGHWLTRALLGMPFDATGAFRLYRLDRIPAEVFQRVRDNGYGFFFESLHRLHEAKFSIVEIPIRLPARTYGHSKMNLRDVARSVRNLLRLFFARCAGFPGAERPAPAASEWDEYWNRKTRSGTWVSERLASVYRRLFIRPMLEGAVRSRFRSGDRLLHAGCGSGQVDTRLGGHVRVTALDVSASALVLYRKNNGPKVFCARGTVFALPFRNAVWDGVYNLGVMEHFAEDEIVAALNEFHRVLKPGGRLLLFWPPRFGLSAAVLDAAHFVLNRILRRGIRLHPAEITRLRSRAHAERLLERAHFKLIDYAFGARDLFTQVRLVAEKDAGAV